MIQRQLKNILLLVTLLVCAQASAQNATVFGIIRDTLGKPVEAVNVAFMGVEGGTSSDSKGRYELIVNPNQQLLLVFTFIGFKSERFQVVLKPGERREVNVTLYMTSSELPVFTIEDKGQRRANFTMIDPKSLAQVPNPSMNFESVLKTFPGVTSNNELSSQYSVRGGNFDENLVYVNDVEIYRPFLIRSGQQEGLTFINSDLVSSVHFSAGGFDARYGDKLSSVLDIQYRKPKKFAGSASLSLLGASVHTEGISKNQKWTYLFGVRQKSNQYVLGSLDTEGEYKPSFTDIQTLLTRDLNDKWELSFLGNYSRNRYNLVPQNRETEFGTVNQALKLRVFFDGQEVDKYESATGAITATYAPNNDVKLKFIASAYTTVESEAYDILGQYYLDELEKDLGSDNFGNTAFNIGVGSYLEHARNNLDAMVANVEHKGSLNYKSNTVRWGIKFQHEQINDQLREWTLIDSADYSLPQEPEDQLVLQSSLRTDISISSLRANGYIQNTFYFSDTSAWLLTVGVRGSYWDFNNEFTITPRATLSHKPRWSRNLAFKASAGLYYQPPFYRELRDPQGIIHDDIKAQRSLHLVLGSDYSFLAWGREFKFVSEGYYKDLNRLVPYKIDNVRIRYLGSNSSHGYATGADFRVNGEFVQGVESWFSLSFLRSEEDLENDFFYTYFNQKGEQIIPGFTFDNVATDSVRTEPGWLPRLTDQRVNFSLFFQDYLPKFPTYKMRMTLIFGSGLPFGPPGNDRYKDVLRFPFYRRVDIGFSKQIIDDENDLTPKWGVTKHLKSLWAGLEVYNLLQVNNTVSYLWVRDVTGRQYAVPNFLTSRQLNFRIAAKF